MSSLPVELTVIWNGDFSIDNPAANSGEPEHDVLIRAFMHVYKLKMCLCVRCIHTQAFRFVISRQLSLCHHKPHTQIVDKVRDELALA